MIYGSLEKPTKIYFFVGFFLTAMVWLYTSISPLEGIHSIRQADTLFAGYSYCVEGSSFALPKIAHRENTSGVAIGELPLFSYILSWPCQLTGQWSEVTPKIITWIFLMLALGVWGMWFQRSYPERWPGFYGFAFLFLISTQVQLHWTIPIPDIFAVLIFGLSLLWAEKKWILSVLFFALGFWIRPYFLPLILLVPQRKRWFWYVLACVPIYFFWYKYWILKSQIEYYNTKVLSLKELQAALPATVQAVLTRFFRNDVNFVGVVLLFFAFRKVKYDFWLWLTAATSLAFVVILKGDHLVNHGYYLGASSLLWILLMSVGLREAPPKMVPWLLGIYLLVMVANTQHLWRHLGLVKQEEVLALIKEKGVAPTDKIATYLTDWPQDATYLYWAKRTGWSLRKIDFDEAHPCPKGAQFFMLEKDTKLSLNRCP